MKSVGAAAIICARKMKDVIPRFSILCSGLSSILCISEKNIEPLKLSITPKMVKAGVRELRESGLLFAKSSADAPAVQRFLETAPLAPSGARKN